MTGNTIPKKVAITTASQKFPILNIINIGLIPEVT